MPERTLHDSKGRFSFLKLWLSTLLIFATIIGHSQTLTQEFVDEGYFIFDAGSVPGVPANYGGLVIRPEEPNTLYIGGSANNVGAALYSIELTRDAETNQVTGFVGTAELVVATPNIDGGVLFAPNGTLLFTQYSQNNLGQVLTDNTYITTDLSQYGVSSSVGSLALVPTSFNGAGNLIFASFNGANLFNVPYTISETGEYLLSNQTATVSVAGTAPGPEGIAYIPQGSDGFPNPSMVISSFSGGKVVAYDTDALGLPDVATARDVITDLTGAEGALIDPVTGDFLFSTFGGGNRVIIMSGFENPNDCAGVPFGESILDDCGVCRLPDDPDFNITCTDCAGVLNGTAFIDNCDDCVGGNTGLTACVEDCNGEFGGLAFLDDCGNCVGGSTGEVACDFDCPAQEANFGDSCDDGNEFTENDEIGPDCECSGELIPQENNSLACSDGIDNDGDGLSDCDDPDCQALSLGCSTCFNDGSSFADVVIDYFNNCPSNQFTDPTEALGVPDFANGGSHATLGNGGYITLGFTDNTLVNSGNDEADLFVFEVGPAVEASTIELRPLNASTEEALINAGLVDSDLDGFYEFGGISGATAVVDIDGFFDNPPAGTLFFDAIKIVDVPGSCSGSSPGADIDGVCALSSVPCAIGSACDDGDDMTENDTINDDCECEGTPIATASLLALDCGGQVIQITGALAGLNDGGTATSDTRTVYAFAPDGGSGVPTYNGGAWPYVILQGGILVDPDITAVLTTNDDGVLLVNGWPAYQFVGDSNSDEANGPGGPWSYYLPTGEQSQDACPEVFDCPILEANIGDACDDGNADTENDLVTENCECEGTNIFDCPTLSANIGDACDDGNADTENDLVTANCECVGTSIFDCPTLSANIGDACDDGDADTENDMVNADCDCEGTPIIVFDCPILEANIGDECDDGNDDLIPGIINDNCECIAQFECQALEANIGDACDDGNPETENDMVNASCNCAGTPIVPSDCQDWVMYLNNNQNGVTDIYGVDISSGNAELDYITTIGYQAHIAYNPENNLIYVINNMNASYVTVNPHTVVPIVSLPIFLSMDIPSITTAAFAPNGKLLIGTMTEDIIYSVNVNDQVVSVFDAYAPINGGDIAFDSMGMLYLATRSGNGYYEVYPDDVLADQLIGNIPSLVTGMALTESEQMIMSHKANSDLRLRNLDGSDAMVSYPLMLDGAPYAHADGDMTSGCNTFLITEEGDCEAFGTFYADINRPGISGTDLYGVEYTVEGNADMTYLTNVDFDAHIAYNAQLNIVYLMNQNGSFVRAYDPTAGIFLGDLAVVGADAATVAVVYNPEDGLLYVGANNGSLKTIDLGTGIATDIGTAPVAGGDLAIQDGKLYLATRQDSKLHEIVGGVAVEVGDIPALVNGMAQANNAADLIIANNSAGVFTKILASDGSTVGTYVPMINGEAVLLYDGDMAAGCSDELPPVATEDDETIDDNSEVEENNVVVFEGMSAISSYPNPTNGMSQVVFITAETSRTLLEVFDMNGRNISTLYNQEAQAGMENRVDFNGSSLPNGIYIYKLTTNKETIIDKFMIAR